MVAEPGSMPGSSQGLDAGVAPQQPGITPPPGMTTAPTAPVGGMDIPVGTAMPEPTGVPFASGPTLGSASYREASPVPSMTSRSVSPEGSSQKKRATQREDGSWERYWVWVWVGQ